MSQNLPNMLDNTIKRVREMVSANTVVGELAFIVSGVI